MNEYAKYQFYFNIFQFLLTCAIGLGAWWRTREKADAKAIKAASVELLARLAEDKAERDKACALHKGDSKQLRDRLDGHNDRLSQHKELINTVESELKHLPTTTDLGKLHEKINTVSNQMSDLKADIREIAGAMPRLTHVTDMMNEFLLNSGGKL